MWLRTMRLAEDYLGDYPRSDSDLNRSQSERFRSVTEKMEAGQELRGMKQLSQFQTVDHGKRKQSLTMWFEESTSFRGSLRKATFLHVRELRDLNRSLP